MKVILKYNKNCFFEFPTIFAFFVHAGRCISKIFRENITLWGKEKPIIPIKNKSLQSY